MTPKTYDVYGCQISIADILKEYKASEPFKEQLDSGHYIYADDRLCLNLPKYVQRGKTGITLTEYARGHEDVCCLRFHLTIAYVELLRQYETLDHRVAFETEPRASAVDTKYEKNPELTKEEIEKFVEASKELASIAGKLPNNFSKMLDKLIKYKGVKEEDLAGDADLDVKTIQRLRNKNPKSVSLDTVVQLCIGLHLHPILSNYLLRAAGIHLMDTDQHNGYRFLLYSCYAHTVPECNEILTRQKCGTLGKSKKKK